MSGPGILDYSLSYSHTSSPLHSRSGITILITCKDPRIHRITIKSSTTTSTGDYEIEKAISVMCAYSFPNNLRHLFAFSHSLPSEPLYLTQVEQYDAVQEFSRLGITDVKANKELSPWKLSSINCDYRVCNTYPQVFVIPRILSDGRLIYIDRPITYSFIH